MSTGTLGSRRAGSISYTRITPPRRSTPSFTGGPIVSTTTLATKLNKHTPIFQPCSGMRSFLPKKLPRKNGTINVANVISK